MARNFSIIGTQTFGVVLLLALFTITSSTFAIPRIVMTVSDTVVRPNVAAGRLNVYMANYNDKIAGFQFVLKSTRPDLMKFRFTLDTVGTLVGGFEYMQAINKAGDSSEYWFRCIANDPFTPGAHPPIPVQPGGLVVRVPYITYPAPPESLGWRCEIVFDKPTDFSDPAGVSIGAYVCPVYDTSYWDCTEYQGDSCTTWVEVTDTSQGYDFMYIDTTNLGCLDTSIVIVDGGAVTLDPPTCDNNGSGTVTINDLTCLITHLFIQPYPATCPTLDCDANGSGSMNILDLTYLVSFLFVGGPPPH